MKRLALLLALASCATAPKALPVTGEAIVTAGREFEAVSAAFVALCHGGTLAAPTCDAYRDFGVRFKAAYPVAVAGWNLAASDAGVFDPAGWSGLLTELAQFSTIALTVTRDGGL